MREEFDKRVLEINVYFEVLKVTGKSPTLNYFDEHNEAQTINIDSNKDDIFRASAFLLLYNLIESTVFNSITTIFDDINSHKHNPKILYFNLIDQIKKYWLDNFFKYDEKIKKETLINSIFEITNKIYNDPLSLPSNLKYGGSLDAGLIHNTAKSLGMDGCNFGTETKDAFTAVKDKRNWLAHGEKTFSEIGRDYDYSKLESFKNLIIAHLENYINIIEDFISNEKYKRPLNP